MYTKLCALLLWASVFSNTVAQINVGDESSGTPVSEGDVGERFFNLDGLGPFVTDVASASIGTVIGNGVSNLGANYLNGCNNRYKRSLLVHRIRKRSPQDVSNLSDDEIAARFCPQDLISGVTGNGGYNNDCRSCSCRRRSCQDRCGKCDRYNNRPQYNTPVYNTPVYNNPPVYNTPVYNTPIYNNRPQRPSRPYRPSYTSYTNYNSFTARDGTESAVASVSASDSASPSSDSVSFTAA